MYVLPIGTTVPTTESKPSGQLQIHPSVPCLWHTSPEPADMMWALTVEGAKRSGVISFFFPCNVQGTILQGAFPASSMLWHLPMGASWQPRGWLLSEFCPLEHNTLPQPVNGCPRTPKSSFPASLPASTSGNISVGHSCALFNKVCTSALPGEGEDEAPSCRLAPFWSALSQSWRPPTCVVSVYLMGF